MSDDKPINLFKAVKELNIGLGTAVDFLTQKGYKVENKPNTKLTREMYDTLLKEYQGDKILKEQSNQINIGKIRREEAEQHEPQATQVKTPEVPAEEILIKNTQSAPESKPAAKQVPVKPAESEAAKAAEPEKAPVEAEKPAVAAEVPAGKPVEKAEEKAPAAEKVTEHGPGLNVVGKIDLSAFDKKKKGRSEDKANNGGQRRAAEKPAAAKAEVPKVKADADVTDVTGAQKPEPALKPVQEIRKEENKPAAADAVPAAVAAPNKPVDKAGQPMETPAVTPADDVIRARATELTGPKVVGKITLPVEPPKRGSNNDSKRPRKRVPGAPFNRDNNQGANAQQGGPGGQRTTGTGGYRQGGPGQGGYRQGGPGRPGQRQDFRNRNAAPAPKGEPTEKEIQDQIKATLARLSGAGKSGKFAQSAKLRRQKRDAVAQSAEEAAMQQQAESKVLRVTEFVTANELATLIDEPVTKIISTCMSLGMFVSINQRLDAETLTIVAEEFGYEVQFIKPEEEEQAVLEEEDTDEELIPRAPVVTIMGHVDHGKTSLLDYIRKANVVAGEAGGITQHIGAYSVTTPGGQNVTFLDTPGHEAFTAMRARGSKVADIAIIVIAADDAVMPQTREAINHAQAANVPLVFAFTKVDKPGANAEKIREQLATMNLLVEDWGGKYQAQEISAKSGQNVDLLLEKVLLEAELLDLKANPKKRAVGTVIEAELDKGRGIVTTVLVQAGTLRVGDPILAGSYSGRVRALTNERGQKVNSAGPSIPVQVLGMQGAPTSGDKFNAMESESEARDVANKRMQLQREQGLRTQKHITLDEIGRRLAIGNFKELNVIIKGDVDGSIEALSDSLLKLSTEEIQVNVISKGVGQISESDVLLASASEAIIIGFQVRPSTGARKLAEQEEIDIRLYSIIYDAINELKSAMEGMLAPEFEEKIVANVEVRETFKISKVGTIAGCMVLDGKINRNSKIRVIREGVVIYTGELASLKRYKDDVKEVSAGYECGLNVQNFNNIETADIIEAYEQVEVKRKL